jgi:hypothetical protein
MWENIYKSAVKLKEMALSQTMKVSPVFCDLHRPPDKSMRIKIIYISVQGKSIGNIKIMRRLKECIGLHRNNLTKTRKKSGDNWSSTSMVPVINWLNYMDSIHYFSMGLLILQK